MRLAVLVSSAVGGHDRATCEEHVRDIRAAFAALGARSEFFLCSPARLTRTARQLASRAFDAVVVAGGDGSASAVADGLAGTAMPLGVLPLGTANHFAKDLGMPPTLAEAARAICEGTTERIDVGEVNGRVFVNNSSIGLYPAAVRLRDRRRGWRKWLAMLIAGARVLAEFPLLSVVVSSPGRTVATRTPFVFVGNNEYTTAVRGLGRRDDLDGGILCVHTVRSRGRVAMLFALLRAMLDRPAARLETQYVSEVSVRVKRRHVDVAVDGEVVRMATPLHYRIRPGALLVRRAPRASIAQPLAAAGGL